MEISVRSTLDGTLQPSLFYPAKEKNRPLLVGLHTWSFDRYNQVENTLPYAEKYNFNLLLPEFRGANVASNPDCEKACGSKYAVQDIFDAIEYVQANYEIDSENIFLLGVSGGGQTALLCAAYHSTYFKAVGAFVPVCDLSRWGRENAYYESHIAACCKNEEEMKKRSPITYAKELSQANLKLFHGKFDTVVSYKQSYDLYTEIQAENKNARVFLDIFDGGHQIYMNAAIEWFLSQYTKKELTTATG